MSSVLRRAYVEVEPSLDGFDTKLTAKLRASDPGGKAGRQIGGQLNQALRRLDLPTLDVKANPAQAFAAIAATEERLRALSRDAATVEVKVRTERALGELGRFRKRLGSVGGEAGPEAAVGFAARLSGQLGPLLSALPVSAPIAAAVGGAAAAAAPLLGAAVAAGVIGGAGIGGVIGGVTIAAKDPRVAAAAADMAFRIGERLKVAADPFVAPILDGLARIERAANRIDLEGIFRDASQFVAPLAEGVSTAVENIGSAVRNLVAGAGPVMSVLGQGIADVSRHLRDGLQTLTDNGPAAAAALRDLFAVINSGIDVAFNLVNALTEVYDLNRKIGADRFLQVWLRIIGASMDDTTGSARRLGSGTFGAAQGIASVTAAAPAAADVSDELAAKFQAADGAARGEVSAMKALSAQLTAQASPAFALIEAQRTLRKAQDDAAAATRNHGRNSDQARDATRRLALAALDLQGKAGSLADGFNGKLTPSMRATFEAAGLTKRQINDVETQLGEARRAADKYAGTYKAKVEITGDGPAGRKLGLLSSMQRALKNGTAIPMQARRAFALATGGPVRGPGTGTSDSIPAMLSNNEHVWTAREVAAVGGHQRVEGLRQAALAGALPAYAAGGPVVWPFPTTARMTRIPSVDEATSAVAPAGPSGSGRTDRWIIAAARALVGAVRVISTFRPGAHTLSGNLSYHARGRAVDFAPSMQLARRWHDTYGSRTKEEITPWRQYDIHNGRPHYYSAPIHRQHSGGNAHVHIAMAGGGVIREPVLGVGASGRSYSFGERGPETVTPGVRPGEVHIHLHNSVIASERQAVDLVAKAYRTAVSERKIR